MSVKINQLYRTAEVVVNLKRWAYMTVESVLSIEAEPGNLRISDRRPGY